MAMAAMWPGSALADSDCIFTSGEATFYPQGSDDGLGFATPEDECKYLVTAGYALAGRTRPTGYLNIKSNGNGCIRGRRSPVAKRLAKGWRAWGTPENVSISGPAGAHAVLAWSKKDSEGKTAAVIYYFSQGVYRTSGIRVVDLPQGVDHITMCAIDYLPLVVPGQSPAPDAPACCDDPYPTPPVTCHYGKSCVGGSSDGATSCTDDSACPGGACVAVPHKICDAPPDAPHERCTFRPRLPGRQCRS